MKMGTVKQDTRTQNQLDQSRSGNLTGDSPTEVDVAGLDGHDAALVDDDGRQSQAALEIQRGVQRVLFEHGYASLTELVLASGRRADVVGLGRKSEIWIVEIKSSAADFKSDSKWPEYRAFCDRFFFAVHSDFPTDILPDDTGLIIADRFGGAIVRQAPDHPIAAARRKAVVLRYARAGADRLLAKRDAGLAMSLHRASD
ncbi:MAG: MmcB family DNA repair protein [Pseudomonadota bacterium]